MKHTFRKDEFAWEGIAVSGYRPGSEDVVDAGYRGVTRHLISDGQSAASSFSVRYLEIAPSGHTRLERHEHIHSVTVIRGEGYAIVGDSVHPLKAFDHVYVPPLFLHQFVNDSDQPFGFLCIVDVQRDGAQRATRDEMLALERNPATAGKFRF